MGYAFDQLPYRERMILFAIRALAQLLTMAARAASLPDADPSTRRGFRDLEAFAENLLDDLELADGENIRPCVDAGMTAGLAAVELPLALFRAEWEMQVRVFESALRLSRLPDPAP